MCSKCSKTSSRNCPYGECSGHYSASSASTSTSSAVAVAPSAASVTSCKHSREDSHHHSWPCGSSSGTSGADDGSSVVTPQRPEEPMDISECHTPAKTTVKCCCQSNMAPICSKCSSVELENNKTKVKLDQLKLVMQQKKERREARKLKNAPYSATIQGASVTTAATALAQLATNTTAAAAVGSGAAAATAGAAGNNGSTAGTTAATSDVPQSHIVEEVDTAA